MAALVSTVAEIEAEIEEMAEGSKPDEKAPVFSMAELEAMREDVFGQDIPVFHEMRFWPREAISTYFRSGGETKPEGAAAAAGALSAELARAVHAEKQAREEAAAAQDAAAQARETAAAAEEYAAGAEAEAEALRAKVDDLEAELEEARGATETAKAAAAAAEAAAAAAEGAAAEAASKLVNTMLHEQISQIEQLESDAQGREELIEELRRELDQSRSESRRAPPRELSAEQMEAAIESARAAVEEASAARVAELEQRLAEAEAEMVHMRNENARLAEHLETAIEAARAT
jgi:hypothetical protein